MIISDPYLRIAIIVFLIASSIFSILRFRTEYKRAGLILAQDAERRKREETSVNKSQKSVEEMRENLVGMKKITVEATNLRARDEAIVSRQEDLRVRDEQIVSHMESMLDRLEKQ